MKMTPARALIAALLVLPSATSAQTCTILTHAETDYVLCKVIAGQDLRLFHKGADGTVLGSFGRISAQLEQSGQTLVFAMNAGMYHRDRSPVGLYIEDGVQTAPIVTAGSAGNFGMRPNGVFCITPDGDFALIESRAYAARPPACRFATQSGPMLVLDGAYHPRFIPDSPSRLVRNGVGVSDDGKTAWFAVSSARVNFQEFAALFKDALGLRQALYFDGNISRLFAPDLSRNDFGFPMGPIVGLVAPRP